MTPVPALPPNAALRWAVVKRIVDALQPVSILEIGCGQGAFGVRLADRARYLGVEPDATSFAVARSRIEVAGGHVRNVGSDQLGGDETFELVCAFEVLEHIEDDVAVLKQWRDHVAPGGHLLLSTPAWQGRFNDWDSLVGHYRRYSPEQMRQLLSDGGFSDVQVIVYGWPLGYTLEAVRTRIAARRGVTTEHAASAMQDRSARSGRILQPRALAGRVMQLGTVPFASLQRLVPQRGTGLVAHATLR